jgi:hypothetical protein
MRLLGFVNPNLQNFLIFPKKSLFDYSCNDYLGISLHGTILAIHPYIWPWPRQNSDTSSCVKILTLPVCQNFVTLNLRQISDNLSGNVKIPTLRPGPTFQKLALDKVPKTRPGQSSPKQLILNDKRKTKGVRYAIHK